MSFGTTFPKSVIRVISLIFGVSLLLVGYAVIDGNNRSRWPYLVLDPQAKGGFHVYVTLDRLDIENRSFKHRIDLIASTDNPLSENDRVCANQVSVEVKSLGYTSWTVPKGEGATGVGSNPSLGSSEYTVPIRREVCKSRITEAQSNQSSQDRSVQADIENNSDASISRYRYPYDDANIAIRVTLQGYSETGNIRHDFEITPTVNWTLDFPAWELASAQAKESKLEFKLQRPYPLRIVTPLLLACVLVFILVIPFISDLGAMAQVATGIVFSLWGLRQILVPNVIQWPIILDSLFVGLYTLLAVAILIRLFVVSSILKPSQETKATNEPGVVPQDAKQPSPVDELHTALDRQRRRRKRK